jgi:uncharacterized membrane-anchored protein YhcB (DUF1043 family)
VDLTTIVIASVCLLVGLAAGSLLTRTLSPQEKKRRELEEQLKLKDDELKTYQRDVSDHLIKTSELVRDMTRNHRELSEQLATSAMRLTAPDISRQVQERAFEGLSADSRPRILSAIPAEPPKDYAPSVPGGVLSESYGLTDLNHSKTQPLTVPPAATPDNDREDDDPTLRI